MCNPGCVRCYCVFPISSRTCADAAQASNICQFGRAVPSLDSGVYVQPGAHIVGDVKYGAQSSVRFGAVIRGDHTPGRNRRADQHSRPRRVARPAWRIQVQIGDGVSVGHHAIIHGCAIGENCLIGMGADRPRWRGYREQHHRRRWPQWCRADIGARGRAAAGRSGKSGAKPDCRRNRLHSQ